MPRFGSSSGRQNLVTLKQKKKSLADTVNEQLTLSALGGRGGGFSAGPEYGDGGVAEEYDFDNTDDRDSGREFGDGAVQEEWGSASAKTKRATSRAAATGKKSKSSASASSASSGSRLRHRGPLDASLSEGKYAAAPVNVEAAMDDIFGALDMGDMDAEGEEYLDDGSDLYGDGMEDEGDEEGSDADEEDMGDEDGSTDAGARRPSKLASKSDAAASRKRRRAKDLSEEEYTAWLEQKSKKEKKSGLLRRPLSFGSTDGAQDVALNSEEADILRQLSELRQTQQVSLVPSASAAPAAAATGDSTANASPSAAAASAQTDAKHTRETVQHFIMVYGQLLRLRVLLQPAVTKAIAMPQYYARALFVERDREVEAEAVAAASNAEDGRRLVGHLEELREAVAERYEEVQEELEEVLSVLYAAATGSGSGRNDEDGSAAGWPVKRAKVDVPSYRAIEKYHQRVLRHADHCLEFWGSKLVQANSAKLKAISQPLPQQIAAILSAKSRLRAKVQKNRSHLTILAHPEHIGAVVGDAVPAAVKAKRALHIAEGDVDVEVYDDADFLRELVRRGGAVASQLEQKVKDMQQSLLPSREGARKGFHRMTKGKAVNYEPRPKLVGFMMAESLEDTERNDVVVKSLFQ